MGVIVLGGARVVLPDGVIERGWVAIDDDRIAGIGAGDRTDAVDVGGSWLLPGFIDLHVHGGAGRTVTDGDPSATREVVAFHASHGTTRLLASLVTAPVSDLVVAVRRLADAMDGGDCNGVLGIHLEGPFLARGRCGAQHPAWMIDPEPSAVDTLLSAGGDRIRVVTIAPERPGALEAIRMICARGGVAAIGHTDADADSAVAAVAAGASLVTHLWNGMTPFHHRSPGVAGYALGCPALYCELIADGAHVHPEVIRMTFAARAHDGIALVTDAIAAAGMGDGEYPWDERQVLVRDGVARLDTDGSLAGSTLTMDAALRRVVGLGVPIEIASRAASLTAARVLGLDGELGAIATGHRADLVLMDDALRVQLVLRDGRRVGGNSFEDLT